MVFTVGCRGPIGPSGEDIQGVDVIPPTIEMNEPWPLSEVWDEFDVSASAVDNVAIREVVFNIDGTPLFNGEFLSCIEPPYTKTIDATELERGWHFVSARAFDTAGNVTDTPVIPIKVGLSSDLSDTVHVSYNNSLIERTWALPDSAHSEAYWVRFSVARTCSLLATTMFLSASFNDTATVSVQVWRGEDFPDDSITCETLYEIELTDSLEEKIISFSDVELRGNEDFFIIIRLMNNTIGDTLQIAADCGIPFWGRSGSKDEDGLHTLQSRYARQDNFIVNCTLWYETESDSTDGL